jgi:hypothetical protein
MFWPTVNFYIVSMPDLRFVPTPFSLPPNLCLHKFPQCNSTALSWPQRGLLSLPQELKIIMNSIQRHEDLGIYFCASVESNPRPRLRVIPRGYQHVMGNERWTKPCQRAYSIGGATPFRLIMIVRLPKLVSSEDKTGPEGPIAFFATVTLVPVQIKDQKFHKHLAVHIGTNQGLSNDTMSLADPIWPRSL